MSAVARRPGLALVVLALLWWPIAANAFEDEGVGWQCPTVAKSSSLPLISNGPEKTKTLLVSFGAALAEFCNFPTGFGCPVTGLEISWSDPSGRQHVLQPDNQYYFAASVTLPANGAVSASCAAAPTLILGTLKASQSHGADNLLLDQIQDGAPGASGLLYHNGSGATQSLYLSVDQAAAGLVLQWTNGSGIARSETLTSSSLGLALTVRNGGEIRYSNGPGFFSYTITPSANADPGGVAIGNGGSIACNGGQLASGTLFDNTTATAQNLLFEVEPFGQFDAVSDASLDWTDKSGAPVSKSLDNQGGEILPVSLAAGSALTYSCGSLISTVDWTAPQ
jgi:hypothetical protein